MFSLTNILTMAWMLKFHKINVAITIGHLLDYENYKRGLKKLSWQFRNAWQKSYAQEFNTNKNFLL